MKKKKKKKKKTLFFRGVHLFSKARLFSLEHKNLSKNQRPSCDKNILVSKRKKEKNRITASSFFSFFNFILTKLAGGAEFCGTFFWDVARNETKLWIISIKGTGVSRLSEREDQEKTREKESRRIRHAKHNGTFL